VIAVFKVEKTLVFWVGLLVFGYSLAQFCAAIWDTLYYVLIYPSVYPVTLTSSLIEAQAVYPLIPLIISGVIFAVIGRYMMKKGVKQNQPSTQN
jgi:hypothetical protein